MRNPDRPDSSVWDRVRGAHDAAGIRYQHIGNPGIRFNALAIAVERLAHTDGEVPEIWVSDDNSSMQYGEDEFHGLVAIFYTRYGDEGDVLFQSAEFGESGQGASRLRSDLPALIEVVAEFLSHAA